VLHGGSQEPFEPTRVVFGSSGVDLAVTLSQPVYDSM